MLSQNPSLNHAAPSTLADIGDASEFFKVSTLNTLSIFPKSLCKLSELSSDFIIHSKGFMIADAK